MYRATTPTHTFTLPMLPTECDVIQVAYKQGGVSLVKKYQNNTLPSGMSFDDHDVLITLTQEETNLFKQGRAQAQIRVLYGGKALASQKMNVSVFDVINEEILS